MLIDYIKIYSIKFLIQKGKKIYIYKYIQKKTIKKYN